MNVLFICNQNQNRSKTAEHVFKARFRTKSAGLYNEKPVSEKQLSWADVVVVMEDAQRSELAKRFPRQYMRKRILSLGIPDVYSYNQPELINMLKTKIDVLFYHFNQLSNCFLAFFFELNTLVSATASSGNLRITLNFLHLLPLSFNTETSHFFVECFLIFSIFHHR